MRAVARAACLLTTRVRVATSVPTVTPSSVTAEPAIRLGETRTPPLATVLTAAAIWATLTERDWPKATRSLVCEVIASPGVRMPGVSPRTPTSVRWPRPNFCR